MNKDMKRNLIHKIEKYILVLGVITGILVPSVQPVISQAESITNKFGDNNEISCIYTLTININGNGSVLKNPEQQYYSCGTVVKLTAIADIGWKFNRWSGDICNNKNPTNIVMNSDKVITAHFTQENYYLNINIDGAGSVTKNPDQLTYNHGTIVKLNAKPEVGWSFGYWTGDLTGYSNPTIIVMDNNKNITAHFIQPQFILDITIDGNGSVLKDPDQTAYSNGTIVTLNANADNGWIFDHWSGDLSGYSNPTIIVMDNNKNIIAHFKNEVDEDNKPPDIKITKPKKKFLYKNDKEIRPIILKTRIIGPITIEANASDNGSGIKKVEFYINDVLKHSDTSIPYNWTWTQKYILPRIHTIKVVAYDNAGNKNSDEITVWKLSDFNIFLNHPKLGFFLTVGALLLINNLRNEPEEEIKEKPDLNRAPNADASGSYEGIVNNPVQFDGSKSNDPDGDTLKYEWDFGDKTTGTGITPKHTYSKAGEYTITLTVTDSKGLSDKITTKAKIFKSESKSTVTGEDNLLLYGLIGLGLALLALIGGIFIKKKFFK